MRNDDVNGAHPRTRTTDKPARPIMNIADIEGSYARERTRHRSTHFANIDYRDVTNNNW